MTAFEIADPLGRRHRVVRTGSSSSMRSPNGRTRTCVRAGTVVRLREPERWFGLRPSRCRYRFTGARLAAIATRAIWRGEVGGRRRQRCRDLIKVTGTPWARTRRCRCKYRQSKACREGRRSRCSGPACPSCRARVRKTGSSRTPACPSGTLPPASGRRCTSVAVPCRRTHCSPRCTPAAARMRTHRRRSRTHTASDRSRGPARCRSRG